MKNYITEHPILTPPTPDLVEFYWQDQKLTAQRGLTIASALFANDIRIFGFHHKDNAPMGIFCANGQCSQCTVIANGLPVKACMEIIQPGMKVLPVTGHPILPATTSVPEFHPIAERQVDCLILGGGPAGLSAAIELGKLNVPTLVVDDKHQLGGKLVLQTHRFFGSINACYAGTRGIDIAKRLATSAKSYPSIEIWCHSTALAVFSDRKVGILKDGQEYVLVSAKMMLSATGAREKSLVFKGNTLPGVYGAGAFQTLVNRDLIRCSQKLFIIGGGNVGLIAGYHALQAGIQVVGLIEALPECGGYKVHKDKLARLGVPIFTSHTIISANGNKEVESVTIAAIDDKWQPIPGTEKNFPCDTILIAVGLDSVREFYEKAKEFGLPSLAAGDAEEIAEASAAMYSGKIRGLEIAMRLGYPVPEIPPDWTKTMEILKSRPGKTYGEEIPQDQKGVMPVFHCEQEIPCNPCTSVCPLGNIYIDDNDIRKIPQYIARKTGKQCTGCERCITICPGLAITLVDYRHPGDPIVTIAYEFGQGKRQLKKDDVVTVVDMQGHILGNVTVVNARLNKATDHTMLVKLRAPAEYAKRIAGILLQSPEVHGSLEQYTGQLHDEMIVCRCERITLQEIKKIIADGCRDMNQIKAMTRAGMGACEGKTCEAIILRAFREMGINTGDIINPVHRPLFMETTLGIFAGVQSHENEGNNSNQNEGNK